MFQARIHRRNHSAEIKTKTNAAATPVINGFSSRIPATLQQVVLSSNRGNNVDKPPPMQVANRAFRTLWSKTFHGGKTAAPQKVPPQKAQTAAVVDVVKVEKVEAVSHE